MKSKFFNYHVAQNLHPLREIIGKTIVSTENSYSTLKLIFSDRTVLIFEKLDNDLLVSIGAGETQ